MTAQRIGMADGMETAVQTAARVFRSGGVVVFPTETVYGIGVAAGNDKALAKLRLLKSRDAAKPFQYLTADLAMAAALGAVFSDKAKRLAERFWPGPLTMVVPAATGDEATLGIRIPDSAFVLAVCRELGAAIISSSANPAGAPPPLNANDADAFGDNIDLLVDGGPVTGGVPSTVVRCLDNNYEILRQGGIAAADIEKVWNR